MIVDKISRYRIVARLQHGQKIPNYWVTMSESIQQNDSFLECIIVNIQKVNHFPILIISTAREEGTLTTLHNEVEVHLNQRF